MGCAGFLLFCGGVITLGEYKKPTRERLEMAWEVVQFTIGLLGPYFLVVNTIGIRSEHFTPQLSLAWWNVGLGLVPLLVCVTILTLDVVIHRTVFFEQGLGGTMAVIGSVGLVYLWAFPRETSNAYAHGCFAVGLVSLLLAIYEVPRFIVLVRRVPVMVATIADLMKDPAKTIALGKR